MKRRRKKISLFKKAVKTVPVLLATVAVVYLGLLIKNIEMPNVLPVTDVVVKGEFYFVKEEDIKTLVKVNMSGGYFSIDLGSIRDLLLQKPWLKKVALRREWPAGLTVYIEEQVAVAYWNTDAYINEDGDVFSPEVIDTTLNLPNLKGPAGQHDKVWKFMNVLYQETAMLDYEVVQLNLDDRRAWQLLLTESAKLKNDNTAGKSAVIASAEVALVEVKLGRFDTTKRLQRFVDILPALIAEQAKKENSFTGKKIKVIDMRYPNGFAVQFAESCMLDYPDSRHSCRAGEA